MQLCRCLTLCLECFKMLSLCFLVAAGDMAHSIRPQTKQHEWKEAPLLITQL